MASERKQTHVKKQDFPCIPSIPLRILAFLMTRSAYSRDAAVKFSTIASELGLESDDVRFHCHSLCAPGFAALEVSGIDIDRTATSVYIATDIKAIHDHAIKLKLRAEQLSGRSSYMERCAMAVAIACQPWADLAAPASKSSAGSV